MTTTNLADLEISQTADRLIIRGRRFVIVLATIATCLFVSLALGTLYKSVVGTADVMAIWRLPPSHRVRVAIVILVPTLFFAATPVVMCMMYLLKRLRPWVFDREQQRLTRSRRSWPLANLTTVAVDIRRGRGVRHRQSCAAVILHWGDEDELEIARFHAGGGRAPIPIETCITVATDLATLVAEFLQVPVRHAPVPKPGFEVITRRALEESPIQ